MRSLKRWVRTVSSGVGSVETVGFRCPVGFKNYPSDLLVGTGTITSKGGRGDDASHDRAAYEDSMNESSANPCKSIEQRDSDGSAEFLSAYFLNRQRERLQSDFDSVVDVYLFGGDVRPGDFDRLAKELRRTANMVEAVKEVNELEEVPLWSE